MENALPTPRNDTRVTLLNSAEDEPVSALDTGKDRMQKTVNTENTDDSVAVKSKNDMGVKCVQQIDSERSKYWMK